MFVCSDTEYCATRQEQGETGPNGTAANARKEAA